MLPTDVRTTIEAIVSGTETPRAPLTEAFTRQHYVAIATVLKQARTQHPAAASALDMVASKLADVFAQDNPNFRPDQFLKATR